MTKKFRSKDEIRKSMGNPSMDEIMASLLAAANDPRKAKLRARVMKDLRDSRKAKGAD